MFAHLPERQGLYDPQQERDSCGVALLARIDGKPCRSIVEDALSALGRLAHRGAVGCDKTGDGVGILVAIPDRFFRQHAPSELPSEPHRYAVGMVFLSQDQEQQQRARQKIEAIVKQHGLLKFLGWRTVPVDPSALAEGSKAKNLQPAIEQFFVEADDGCSTEYFERHLYIITKQIDHLSTVPASSLEQPLPYEVYLCSLSNRTITYKGLLLCPDLGHFYKDLQDELFSSHIALVHARFSTNTFPSWSRAQPYRVLCHNGEINTLRGNVHHMQAREGHMKSPVFSDSELEQLFPVIDKTGSDSAMLDNVLQFWKAASARSLPHAITSMVI